MTVMVAFVFCFASASQARFTREIAPGVYSFASGGGYFSMFAVTDKGVAVFETVNTKHSTALLRAVRKITDKPIVYAFHSHNHWDNAGGGKVFQKVGAKTVMHAAAAEWLAVHPGKETSPPDVVWQGARRDIKLGDLTIQLHYLGLNHGLGMTVFVIPERRTSYIADLVTPERLMFTIVPDFNIREWERSLKEILNLNFDNAVCSHNALPMEKALAGCNKDQIKGQLHFITDFLK